LLTVVPAGRWDPDEVSSDTAAWFPAVGLLFGVAGFAVIELAQVVGWQGSAPLVLGGVIVALWAFGSRMLHWDGLADTADGLYGGATPARRLEIMRDSTNGSFASVAVALVAIVQVAAIGSIVSAGLELVLVAVPAVARLSAVFAAWLGRPVRPASLGGSVMGRPSILGVLIAALWAAGSLAVLVVALGAGLSTWVLVAVALGAALVVPHVLSGGIGGVNGDIMGASILLVETACFGLIALSRGA